MSQPLISIAMTTYNGEKYLREQLDSILNQTYSNFELIICDDCSKDSTWQILEEYAQNDNRIKIYKNEHNLGFKKNFEKAISLCNADYIALSDQDDIWLENHLGLLFNNIDGKSMSAGNTLILENGELVPHATYSKRHEFYRLQSDEDLLIFIMFFHSPCQGASSLYRKDLLIKAMPIPEGVLYHDAWFSACACCMSGVGYTFEPISIYRLHDSNVSGNHENRTLLSRVKSFFEKEEFETDRFIYCDELGKRFPEANQEIQKIISDANTWFINKKNHKGKKNLFYFLKNYKRIYATDSISLLPARLVSLLLKK